MVAVKRTTIKERKSLIPFLLYVFISLLLLPPVAMRTYGRAVERYGGLSMNGMLYFFQRASQLVLAILQTAVRQNPWENMYREKEAERRKLEFELAELRRSAKEVEQLRKLLSLNEAMEWQHLNAEVIVRSGSTLRDSIMINAGENKGLYPDAPVIGFGAGKYGLLGKVQTVGKTQSTVVSLANRYYQIGVTAILEASRFQGILSSAGRFFRLDFINRQARSSIESGGLVLSAGSPESLYPKGIPIGHILKIEEQEYNASLSVIVRPVVEPSQVEYVAVLLKKEPINPEPIKTGQKLTKQEPVKKRQEPINTENTSNRLANDSRSTENEAN